MLRDDVLEIEPFKIGPWAFSMEKVSTLDDRIELRITQQGQGDRKLIVTSDINHIVMSGIIEFDESNSRLFAELIGRLFTDAVMFQQIEKKRLRNKILNH